MTCGPLDSKQASWAVKTDRQIFTPGAIEMSYLNALRLHFAGQFQANPSTVNNDPGHFDNATFQPSYTGPTR
jgi:hypothetical protein